MELILRFPVHGVHGGLQIVFGIQYWGIKKWGRGILDEKDQPD